MKYIIEAFSILFVVILNLFLCIGIVTVSADVAAAKEYKAEIVAEIENSNFNPIVIEACKQQASLQGYSLDVRPIVYDTLNDRRIAEVELTYTYEIPLLGVSQQRVTRAAAR